MKRPLTLLTIPLTALAVAACGSSSHKTTASPPATTPNTPAASTPATTTPAATQPPAAPSHSSTLAVAADPSGQLKFAQSNLSTTAGKVTISFTNQSPIPHNIVLISASNKILGQTPTFQGGSKSFTVTLTPGTYTYYCSVPGHRQAGMQGTLTVS
jgi:plastocyanin